MSDESMHQRARWLEGYYPPDMDAVGGWECWIYRWTMSARAPANWVLIPGGYFNEAQARAFLQAAGKPALDVGADGG